MGDRLYIFGTCSGTEPKTGRHHVSFAIRCEGRLYWFDAGECCSYTAHLMGVDARDARCVFISHPHMDHVGGLGNLFWNMRKLDGREGKMDGKTVELFMPNRETWPAQLALLKMTEGGFQTRFQIREHRIEDGVIFEENGLRVTALHNTHMPALESGERVSYSFAIDLPRMRIAYSGDVGDYMEIEPLLSGADIVLAETGHHRPADVCAALNRMRLSPRTLMFIHHGRAILDDCENAMREARAIYGGEMLVLNDATSFPLTESV